MNMIHHLYFYYHDTSSKVIMFCMGRPLNAIVACRFVISARPQYQGLLRIIILLYIINNSHSLIYIRTYAQINRDWFEDWEPFQS